MEELEPRGTPIFEISLVEYSFHFGTEEINHLSEEFDDDDALLFNFKPILGEIRRIAMTTDLVWFDVYRNESMIASYKIYTRDSVICITSFNNELTEMLRSKLIEMSCPMECGWKFIFTEFNRGEAERATDKHMGDCPIATGMEDVN